MSNKFIRGSFYLTSATLISKILGFIYVMPFTLLVGTSGYALYKYAYGPYTIMLYISTLGLPSAVSKYVAKHNSLGDYQASKDLLKTGFFLMLITGFIGFLILFFSAPFLATLVTSKNDTSGNDLSDVIYVIRMVSFALIVVPSLSLLRGFFQGNQSMGPPAFSTVFEQIVRISFILLGSLFILKVFSGSITQAVGLGTFGAFVGGLSALIFLIIIFLKRKKIIYKNIKGNSYTPPLQMYKELVSYAIPFVIVGSTLPIYQNIDTYSINALFRSIGYSQAQAEEINSVIGLAQILVMVPVSLSTALSISLIPELSSAYTKGDNSRVLDQFKKAYHINMFFILPASVGLLLLSNPIFLMIFGVNNSPGLGGLILGWYAPMALVFSIFSIFVSTLQGIEQQKHAIIGMILGVIVKLSGNYILASPFMEIGPVIATYLGYMVSILYYLAIIKKNIKLPLTALIKPIIPISLVVILMATSIKVITFLTKMGISGNISDYKTAVLTSLISVFCGGVIYLTACSRLGIIRRIF